MKPKNFIIYFFIFLWACSSEYETVFQWDKDLTAEQNIAKNAIALGNNNDFSFFDDIVRDRSIIVLGEEGHYDNATIEVKINMINYLQKKGFQSVALEGAPFLASYIFSNPKYAELTKDWTIENLWGLTDLKEKKIQPFLKTIKERKTRIWGIDFYAMSPYDIDAVRLILNEYSTPSLISINWDKLKILYYKKFIQVVYFGCPDCPVGKLSTEEQYELMRMIDSLSNFTQYVMFSKGANMELKVIMQWIRNLNTAFSYHKFTGIRNEDHVALAYRNRDIQMAENIDWILKNFPNEKFIVWTANLHGSKDISQTRYPTDSLLYFNYQSMGEFINYAHENKMYSLAFTSYNCMPEKEIGNLEKEIANTIKNAPYAFINFESLRFAENYRDKEFESSIMLKKQGKWLHIFDGLYYIRDQIVKE